MLSGMWEVFEVCYFACDCWIAVWTVRACSWIVDQTGYFLWLERTLIVYCNSDRLYDTIASGQLIVRNFLTIASCFCDAKSLTSLLFFPSDPFLHRVDNLMPLPAHFGCLVWPCPLFQPMFEK